MQNHWWTIRSWRFYGEKQSWWQLKDYVIRRPPWSDDGTTGRTICIVMTYSAMVGMLSLVSNKRPPLFWNDRESSPWHWRHLQRRSGWRVHCSCNEQNTLRTCQVINTFYGAKRRQRDVPQNETHQRCRTLIPCELDDVINSLLYTVSGVFDDMQIIITIGVVKFLRVGQQIIPMVGWV